MTGQPASPDTPAFAHAVAAAQSAGHDPAASPQELAARAVAYLEHCSQARDPRVLPCRQPHPAALKASCTSCALCAVQG